MKGESKKVGLGMFKNLLNEIYMEKNRWDKENYLGVICVPKGCTSDVVNLISSEFGIPCSRNSLRTVGGKILVVPFKGIENYLCGTECTTIILLSEALAEVTPDERSFGVMYSLSRLRSMCSEHKRVVII